MFNQLSKIIERNRPETPCSIPEPDVFYAFFLPLKRRMGVFWT